jgi:hypothetical protein
VIIKYIETAEVKRLKKSLIYVNRKNEKIMNKNMLKVMKFKEIRGSYKWGISNFSVRTKERKY